MTVTPFTATRKIFIVLSLARFRQRAVLFALLWLAPLLAASGTEWFVAPNGDDSLGGRSPEAAWQSVQKGVDALEPGDILTLLPGEYPEQLVVDKNATAEQPVVIRAARPGFSALTGWERVSGFQRVKGHRFVYSRKLETPVFRLVENDTGAMLLAAPSLADMDRFRGSFLVDQAAGILYVHASDGQSPDAHSTMATVRSGNGITLRGSHVRIEGLVINGFSPVDHEGTGHGYGIRVEGSHHTIRNCSFLANGGAVTVKGEDCLIEGNYMARNIDPGYNELAQLYCSGGSQRTKVINNIVLDGQTHGIRFYGHSTDCTAIGNIIKNARIGLYFKASRGARNVRRNVVVAASLFNWHSGEGREPMLEDENTFQQTSIWQTSAQAKPGKRTLLFHQEEEPLFCAPQQLDYRLQATSPGRGTGPAGVDLGALPYDGNVFFISPDGDDKAQGQSVVHAFRTLERALREARPGTTFYLLPGVYDAPGPLALSGQPDQPIVLRSRDPRDQATLRPRKGASHALALSGSGWLKVEDVTFEGPVTVSGSKEIIFDRCRITHSPAAAFAVKESHAIWLRRSTIWQAAAAVTIDAGSTGVTITSSILNARKGPLIDAPGLSKKELFTEYNNYVIVGKQAIAALREGSETTLQGWAALSGNDRRSMSGDPGFLGESLFDLEPSSALIGAGELGGSIGATAAVPQPLPPLIEEVTEREVTPTTASFSWWTPQTSMFGIRSPQQWPAPLPISSELWFGKDPDDLRVVQSFGDVYHQVSLHHLEPGTTYYYKIVIPEKPGMDYHREGYSYQKEAPGGWRGMETKLATFTTPKKDEWKPKRTTIYVSPDGERQKSGATPEEATTLTEAGDRVRAGDTVVLLDGIYHEAFTPVATGVPGAPITLRALHTGKAVMDGSSYTRPSAVALFWKDQMIIDGVVARRFGGLTYGSRAGLVDAQIYLSRCGAVEVRNSVLAGYGFYTKGVTARNVRRLTLVNNAILGFPNSVVGTVEEGAFFTGNTWYVTMIRCFMVDGPVFLKNNLFFGQNTGKIGGAITPMVTLYPVADSDYNAYYFSPKNTKGYIGFGLESSEEQPARLAMVRERLKLDQHSLEPTPDDMQFAGPLLVDYFNLKDLRALSVSIAKGETLPSLEWFAMPKGNRLNHAGEGGKPIGARPVALSVP